MWSSKKSCGLCAGLFLGWRGGILTLQSLLWLPGNLVVTTSLQRVTAPSQEIVPHISAGFCPPDRARVAVSNLCAQLIGLLHIYCTDMTLHATLGKKTNQHIWKSSLRPVENNEKWDRWTEKFRIAMFTVKRFLFRLHIPPSCPVWFIFYQCISDGKQVFLDEL